MMDRITEPELMDDAAQARAYANADFEQAHSEIMRHFTRCLAAHPPAVDGGADGAFDAVDLGCGDADIAVRLAKLHHRARVAAVDGAQEMLRHAQRRIDAAGVGERVHTAPAVLPQITLPERAFDVIVSNSLLHHLHDPQVLWRTARRLGKPGACVFIADLSRPDSPAQVEALVKRHAANEDPILQRDFHNSLLAAFTPAEVENQLQEAGLGHLAVRTIDDHHLTVCGALEA